MSYSRQPHKKNYFILLATSNMERGLTKKKSRGKRSDFHIQIDQLYANVNSAFSNCSHFHFRTQHKHGSSISKVQILETEFISFKQCYGRNTLADRYCMKLTRTSWPIHEYDAFRVAAQKIANARQKNSTTSEKIETFPRRGKFTAFSSFLHFLLKKY